MPFIIQETVNNLKEEKERALEAENYLAAEALELKQEEQTKQITELFTDTMSNLDNQIQQSWESLANILAKESRIAENLAEASQKAKEDRAQKLDKADFNYKCHHEMKLQQINAQRAEIGQEKSEIAFDLDMWIQSDAELNEKMYELVHEDLDEKEELESKENALQTQIDELLRSVKKLEKERDMHRSRINELDTAIEQVLSKHEPEKDAHLNEHTLIETRKEQMDIRCTNLDQEDTELHHQLKRHTEEIAEEWALLGEEEKRIREISVQADNSKFEADKMTQTCLKVVKACNKSVMEKKKEVSQVCEKLADHRKKLEYAQKNRFAARQKLDELEEMVEHTEYQIKSLNRQKTLAVESRQFQSAAATAERIKSSQSLLEGLSKKRDSQEEESKRFQLVMLECENEMDRLEKEYKTLVNLAGTSIVEQLEDAKSSLQETESLQVSTEKPCH
ncbi:hypothetical protein CLU79DRAFT_113882 [Phycomyces nitens]|nr:hypothetical protein CLU79DRAFT_113882 [Phycomyces nitens]